MLCELESLLLDWLETDESDDVDVELDSLDPLLNEELVLLCELPEL